MANYQKSGKSPWAMVLMILSGIVLGGFLGQLAGEVSFLKWLNFGYEFGLKDPMSLDLQVIYLSLKILININIASIIGMIVAVIIYRKL